MLNCPLRYCNRFRRFNAVVNNNGLEAALLGQKVSGNSRTYSNDKDSCCKDISQTEGKRIEQWPKCDPPPPAWRVECPRDPQPPNYDPYRIKVPDVVVPPLPPSNAKWMGVVLTTRPDKPGGQEQAYQEPGYTTAGAGQQNPQSADEQPEKQEEIGSGGFFGYLRSLFGKDKGKTGKGEGEVSMIGQKEKQWITYYQERIGKIRYKIQTSSVEQGTKIDFEILSEDSKELFNTAEIKFGSNVYQGMQDLFHNSPIIHPDYWKEKPGTRLSKLEKDVQEPLLKLGYHGKQKYKYAFHEPWKPLDRITLLAQAEREEFGEIDIPNSEKTDEQLT